MVYDCSQGMSLYFNRKTLRKEETEGLSSIAGHPIMKREDSWFLFFLLLLLDSFLLVAVYLKNVFNLGSIVLIVFRINRK